MWMAMAVTKEKTFIITQPLEAEESRSGSAFFNKMLKFAAFPIAAIVGFSVTQLDTRGRARRQAERGDHLFDDFLFSKVDEKTGETIEGIIDRTKRNQQARARVENPITLEDFVQEENAIKKVDRKLADDRMELVGRGNFWGQF